MSAVNLDILNEAPVVQTSKRAQEYKRGLTQKAYLNAFASFLDYTVKIIVLSVLTPILVAGLGSSMFGVWQMLSRLVSYMQAADGRPTQALKWLIAHDQALDNDEDKRRHVGSALVVWVLFLPVLLTVGGVLIWLSPMMSKVAPEMYGVVRWSCFLLVFNFLLLYLVALPEAVLRGMNLGYKRMGLQAGLNVVGGALMVGALYLNTGLIGLAMAQVILAALTGLLFFAVVKKYVAWFGVARPKWSDSRAFLKISLWWAGWTSVHKLMTASDVLVLGVIASSSLVTTYTLTSYAGLTLMSIVTMILGAVTPGMGGVIGLKQFDRAAALRSEMLAVSWILLTAMGATILLWNRSFVALWVGTEYFAGSWANLLIVIAVVQSIFIRNDAYIIDLTLNLREKVLLGALSAVLSILFSALLIPRLGIVGLNLGLVLGRLILTVAYPMIVNGRLHQQRKLNLPSLLRPGLTMGILFTLATLLGENLLARNWILWVAGVGLSLGCVFLTTFFVGVDAEMRARLTKRLMMARQLRGAA